MAAVTSHSQIPNRTHYGGYTPFSVRHPHRSALERRKFSLLIRLPDGSLTRIKKIKDGTSIEQIKRSLELSAGLPAPTYQLFDVEGFQLDSATILRLDGNVIDNSILKLSLLPPYNEVVQLLKKGEDSHSQLPLLPNENEDTVFNVLYIICYAGNTTACETLLKSHGISVSLSTTNGNTLLHAAAVKGHIDTADLLCKHGADIYQTNSRGSNPLDVALEFGSFTCERHLRLSQWARRKDNLKTREEASELTLVPQSASLSTDKYVATSNQDNIYHDSQLTKGDRLTDKIDMDNNEVPGREADKLQHKEGEVLSHFKITRARSANVNHKMPQSAVTKRKERLSRVKSAPPLNSEEKNQRMCKTSKPVDTDDVKGQQPRSKEFKVTRPQYLQYIKSSTGVVEEDYFADLFPQENEKPTIDYRSFDDQMKRNERIFKKMFKESGVVDHSSDTDSEEENIRQFANRKAVKRWEKRKEIQKRNERLKERYTPSYPTGRTRDQCLGELLMIGDTTTGEVSASNSNTYINAYQTYRRDQRSKSALSAVPTSRHGSNKSIDPVTYEEWIYSKPTHKVQNKNEQPSTEICRNRLKKKIDYQTWVERANQQLKKQIMQRKTEEKQKKEFNEWIQELKTEFGTYNYWKRRKEEQLRKEKQLEMKKQEEMSRKMMEKEKRQELAKDIYKRWVVGKELRELKLEEKQLEKERHKLRKLKNNQDEK